VRERSFSSSRAAWLAVTYEIVQALQEVIDLLQEIRREVLRQELTSVLHNETLSVETRKERVAKIFQLLA
jgi:phosphopantothenate synthetase